MITFRTGEQMLFFFCISLNEDRQCCSIYNSIYMEYISSIYNSTVNLKRDMSAFYSLKVTTCLAPQSECSFIIWDN